MKISIDSISFNEEIIKSILSYDLRIDSFDFLPNNQFNLIISGKFPNLFKYLQDFGYIEEFQDKEMMMNELDLYFIE